MSPTEERRPPAMGTAFQTAAKPSTILTRPADSFRAWRIRRWASRELDRMLEVGPWVLYSEPLKLGEPIDWTDHALTWQQRERAGRELRASGYVP